MIRNLLGNLVARIFGHCDVIYSLQSFLNLKDHKKLAEESFKVLKNGIEKALKDIEDKSKLTDIEISTIGEVVIANQYLKIGWFEGAGSILGGLGFIKFIKYEKNNYNSLWNKFNRYTDQIILFEKNKNIKKKLSKKFDFLKK